MCFHFINIVFNYSTPTSRQVQKVYSYVAMICLEDYYSVNVRLSEETHSSTTNEGNDMCGYIIKTNLVAAAGWLKQYNSVPPQKMKQ